MKQRGDRRILTRRKESGNPNCNRKRCYTNGEIEDQKQDYGFLDDEAKEVKKKGPSATQSRSKSLKKNYGGERSELVCRPLF